MNNIDRSEQRLVLPPDVQADDHSFELISVWYSNGKAKVLSRTDTGLDDHPRIWAEIIAGIVENVADHVAKRLADDRLRIEQTIADTVAMYCGRKS